jgi:hypothetical protein
LAAAVEFAVSRLRRAPIAGSASPVVASIEQLEARQLLSGAAWLSADSAATWDASTSTLTVTGVATIIADPGSDEPNIIASGSAAQLTIAPTPSPADVHVGGITLTDGATLDMASVGPSHSNSNHNTLVVGVLGATNDPPFSIDSASKLDLVDNDLIVHTGSSDNGNGTQDELMGVVLTNELQNVAALAAEGRNVAPGGISDGTWTGDGLTSSAAGSVDSAANTGEEQNILAVAQNSDLSFGGYAHWTIGSASESLGANDILVKYTYNGDLNLDGKVDGADYNIFAFEYDGGATTGDTYAEGDLNGNGQITASDFAIFDSMYGLGLPPSALAATSSNASSISLSWDAADDAQSYNIYRKGPQDDSFVKIDSVGGDLTSYTDTSAASDTAYLYQVTAVFDLGETTPTNTVTARTLSDLAAGNDNLWSYDQAPQNPNVFNSSASGGVELGVQFSSDVGGYLSGIQFFKGAQEGGTQTGELWDASGNLLATATFTNESQSGWQQVDFSSPVLIAAGTPYTVSYHTTGSYSPDDSSYFGSEYNSVPLHVAPNVNGVYADGASAFPSSTSGNSDNYWVQPLFVPYSVLNPAAPSDLTAAAVSSFEIDLAWTNPDDPSTSFQIERSDDGGTTFNVIDQTAAGATTYQDLTVSDNVTYYYKVIAVSAQGPTSGDSNVASATTPLATFDGLTATAVSTSEIDLAWTDNSGGTTAVQVWRSPDGETFSPLVTLPAGTNSYQDLGLPEATGYFYAVQPVSSSFGVGMGRPSRRGHVPGRPKRPHGHRVGRERRSGVGQ